ncbi:MAG: serine/threonine-protein kinase [Vicinamibacterales bacterium]
MIGRRLSHFYVLRSLGSGGMGVVCEAQDLRLPRSVAIKVLKPALARDTDAMRRFRREARLAASLNHPNICTILEVEDEGAQPFIVMELLQGRTLKTLIGQRPLAEAELLGIGVQIAAALGTAHDHGIMHRDVTPGNVFMTVDGRIKVLDFGLAKQYRSLDDDTLLTDDVTRTGEAPGTVHYMAPEQFDTDATVDHRCDLYSLGAVLYQAASGSRPFDAATRNELVSAIREQAPTPLRQLAPHVSPGLAVVVERLLEQAPALRYQSAWNLHADLEEPSKRSAGGGRGEGQGPQHSRRPGRPAVSNAWGTNTRQRTVPAGPGGGRRPRPCRARLRQGAARNHDAAPVRRAVGRRPAGAARGPGRRSHRAAAPGTDAGHREPFQGR